LVGITLAFSAIFLGFYKRAKMFLRC